MVDLLFDAKVNEGYLPVFLLYYEFLNNLRKHFSYFLVEYHT